MSDIYQPSGVPQEYDNAWLAEELARIAAQLSEFEIPTVRVTPIHVAPVRPREGMVVNADGTNWNPGGGAGLYQYLSGAWVKL